MNESQPTRRRVLKILGTIPMAALACGNYGNRNRIPHIITLSFDDGFEKSSIETARIYGKYGLSASINVIAAAHQKDFVFPNEYHRWPVGDFGLWNRLKAEGHEIMPHGLKHEDLAKCGFDEAKASITECLDIFSEELNGFDPKKAIFNFPYNSSSPEVEEWLKTMVKAFRTGGDSVNPSPFRGQARLTCVSSGPGNIDRDLDFLITKFLEGPPGWLIFNSHGLDGEGWGPVGSSFLDELLDRLSHRPQVRVLTVSQALDSILS